jgi:hypothetical protein
VIKGKKEKTGTEDEAEEPQAVAELEIRCADHLGITSLV